MAMANTAPSSLTAGSCLSALSPFSSCPLLSSVPLHRSRNVHRYFNMCAPLRATSLSSRTSATAPDLKEKTHPETVLWERFLYWIRPSHNFGAKLQMNTHKSPLDAHPGGSTISDSDKKPMLGHNLPGKAELAPILFLRMHIENAIDRFSLFAADIVSDKINQPSGLMRHFTQVSLANFVESMPGHQFVGEALVQGNPPLKVFFDWNGLVSSSSNVNMYRKGNRSMLKTAVYAQGAICLNGMREKHYREPLHQRLKAAAKSELRQETDDVNLEGAKKALIRAVANTNRGKNTSLDQRKHILKMINELENANPTKNPVKSPLLSGFWSLLYTAPIDESTSDKYAGTQEGPFLARVKPMAFGSIRQTRSSQVIDVEGGVAKNIADFTFLGKDGTLTIKGNAAPSSINGKETTRLDVVFEEFSVRIGKWTSPNVSLRWINPQGWVDTTFLDEDMRIGRGDKGSVFVSARAKM